MGKKGGGGVRMKQMGPSKEQRAMMKQMQDMQNGGGMMNPLQDLMQMPPEIHLPPTPDKSMKIIWPMRKFFLKVCVWCVCFIIWYIILLFIRKTRGTELLWSPVRAGSCMFVWIMLRMISPETAGTRTRKTPKGSKRKTKKRWRLLLTRLRKCIWGNFLRKELYSIYCFWRENCHNLTILRSYLSFWILYLLICLFHTNYLPRLVSFRLVSV